MAVVARHTSFRRGGGGAPHGGAVVELLKEAAVVPWRVGVLKEAVVVPASVVERLRAAVTSFQRQTNDIPFGRAAKFRRQRRTLGTPKSQ